MKRRNERLRELESVYSLSIETRNFEINQLINRNNFIMLFQGVLLAAVFQNQASKPVVEAIICLCGVFVSAFQVALSSGAKYWQEHWELKTEKIEELLKTEHADDKFIALFSKGKNESLDPCRECERRRHALYIWVLLAIFLFCSVLFVNGQMLCALIVIIAFLIVVAVAEVCGTCDESAETTANHDVDVTPQDMRKKIFKGVYLNPASILIYRKYSVSKVPVYVGLSLVVTWSALALHSFGVDYFGWAKGHIVKPDNYRKYANSSYRKPPE